MTDRADISSSDESNDAADVPEDSEAAEGKKTTEAEITLIQREIIAQNREKAMQIRAAKRSLPQEPVTLVLNACLCTIDY